VPVGSEAADAVADQLRPEHDQDPVRAYGRGRARIPSGDSVAGVLFLYRPPQTWMPYALPRNRTEQGRYNRELQDRYQASMRADRTEPAGDAGADTVARLRDLADLHASGALSDDEFAAAKAKVLGPGNGS
jgi:hypothetical protein